MVLTSLLFTASGRPSAGVIERASAGSWLTGIHLGTIVAGKLAGLGNVRCCGSGRRC